MVLYIIYFFVMFNVCHIAGSYPRSTADTLLCTQAIRVESLAGFVIPAFVLAATLLYGNALVTTEEEATVAGAPLLARSFTGAGCGRALAGSTATLITNLVMAVGRALGIWWRERFKTHYIYEVHEVASS